MRKSHIVASAVLGAALVASVWIAGCYFNKARGHAKTVSVVGGAQRDFTSDLVVWNLSVNTVNMDKRQGYAELKNMTQLVKDYLIGKGIKSECVDFKPITTYNKTEWVRENGEGHDRFVGYDLTQRIRIESSEVEKIEQLSRDISELMDKGVNIDGNDISYYYTKLADLKVEMLAEATANAKTRAETIAKSACSRLGGLQTANMGVFQITAPNSSDEDYSWGGTFNTSSKNKRASINMRLTYYVR